MTKLVFVPSVPINSPISSNELSFIDKLPTDYLIPFFELAVIHLENPWNFYAFTCSFRNKVLAPFLMEKIKRKNHGVVLCGYDSIDLSEGGKEKESVYFSFYCDENNASELLMTLKEMEDTYASHDFKVISNHPIGMGVLKNYI